MNENRTETEQPKVTDAVPRSRWKLPAGALDAIRRRLGQAVSNNAGCGDTEGFRRWRDAKDALREVDAVEEDLQQ